MADTTSKRRGKKDSTSKPKDEASNSPQLEEQLARARAAIETSQKNIDRLHQQWRSQLVRMGMLVVLITMHQSYGPAATCYQEVTEWNSGKAQFSPTQVAMVVVSDSLVYGLALLLAVVLVLFMRSPYPQVTDPLYLMANSVIPAILALHFLHERQATYETLPDCIATNFFLKVDTSSEPTGTASRPFPVVLAFHVIVSCCFYFMSQQRKKQATNLESVQSLIDEIESKKKR